MSTQPLGLLNSLCFVHNYTQIFKINNRFQKQNLFAANEYGKKNRFPEICQEIRVWSKYNANEVVKFLCYFDLRMNKNLVIKYDSITYNI